MPHPRRLPLLLVITLLALAFMLPSQPAHALTYIVTTLADSGAGSLRQAIIDANATLDDDTITFSVSGTIGLASILPNLVTAASAGTLTINGAGAITVTRSSGTFRIFIVDAGANVTLNGLSITNGNAGFGGGGGIAIVNGGTLMVTNSTLSGNTASGGGGIVNGGTMTVTNSTLNGNSANGNGGGIVNFGTLTMTNSTLSGNTAGNGGGGIFNFAGTLTVTNSTLSGNTAGNGGGGGIRTFSGTANLNNTIVANSVGGDCNIAGGTVNAENSLIEDNLTCVNGTNTNNLTGDPNLVALTGSPAYFPLNVGSSAIDTGNDALAIAAGITLDQAGNPRFNGTVDRGSYEVPAPLVNITPMTFNVNEGNNADFTITRTGSTAAALMVDVTITQGAGTTLSDYTLSGGSISGQSGNVTVTIPAAAASVNVNMAATDDIDAEPDNTLTLTVIDGAAYDLGTPVSSTATSPANDLVVTNTNDAGEGSLRQAITNANAFASNDTITFAASANGTITLLSALPDLANNGTLAITGNGAANTIVSGNNAVRVFNVAASANVTLNGLTITNGNAVLGNGGGIANFGGTLTVTNSTLSGNSADFVGGGIVNFGGALTVTGSYLFNNTAVTGDGVFSTNAGSVTTTCLVGNGDTAVINTTGTLTATGNWWGTSWGPNIPAAPALTGSVVSSGDSIGGTGEASSRVNVGIVNVPTDYGTYNVAPIGSWLLVAPAGCDTCLTPSGVGTPRSCLIPRPP